jgi:phage terminase large subunit-like protein
MHSQAEFLSDQMSEEELQAFYDGFTPEELESLLWDWSFWGRPEQQEPPRLMPNGNIWRTWLILSGRGWGKTRTLSEWIRANVCGSTPLSPGRHKRIALVAETAADARDVIVEGDSGILKVHPDDFCPHYEPSKRRLTWPNGAIATLYNAVEPDQLRGPQHDLAACDELAKWRYCQETWDNLQFGLRLGSDPRIIITTTPRPIPLLRAIANDPTTIITRGSTYDNAGNLAPQFLQALRDKYEGTRLGRQEVGGEILDDSPDALWRRAKIDEERIVGNGTICFKGPDRQPFKMPDMRRIVVAIDPAGVSGANKGTVPEGAETGIIVAGLGIDGRGYVLADGSCGLDPFGWAQRAVELYDQYEADLIVAETNQGGEMVEHTIRTVRRTIPYKGVHAARGKATRAEPVAALYEQGRVSHVGSFTKLEDQMVVVTPFGPEGGTTADRVDALVWALTNLFPQIVHFQAAKQKGEEKVDRWRYAFEKRNRSESWKTL